MLKKPMATYKLAVAARYWHSARIVISNQIRPVEFFEPVGLLLCMATELALKAFSLDAGMTEKQLSSKNEMGHDLGKVLLACIKRGLELSEDDVDAVLVMRPAHLAHFHRYGFGDRQGGMGAILLADEKTTLVSVARLIDRVSEDPAVLRKSHQHPKDLDCPETFRPLSPVTSDKAKVMMDQVADYASWVRNIGEGMR